MKSIENKDTQKNSKKVYLIEATHFITEQHELCLVLSEKNILDKLKDFYKTVSKIFPNFNLK